MTRNERFTMQLEIRLAETKDLPLIVALFKDCVLTVCKEDYSEEQVMAWAAASENTSRWTSKIENQFFIVAIDKGAIVGFGSLEGHDKIDLLYVHKDCQGLGVGTKVFECLVSRAQSYRINILRADVSRTAWHFFVAKGFTPVLEQSKEIDGTTITNYQMQKSFD